MQTIVEVRRIDLWALFKVSFFVYAILGLVGGFVYLFLLMIASSIGSAFIEEEIPNFGLLGGAIGIILMPILAFLFGAMGSVGATVFGAIFNLIIKATGGLKFDVDYIPVEGLMIPAPPLSPMPPPPSSPPPPPGLYPAGPATPGPSDPQV
jgi:hypothetical protein